MSSVTIVDYDVGNLFSVDRAFAHLNLTVRLSSDHREIETAERLVLPGVGAFADGMASLREKGLIESIRRFADSGRPLLGICLGMQMLFESSSEYGNSEGLGLLKGEVVQIPSVDVEGNPLRLPHVGWNELVPASGASWEGSILNGLPTGTCAYFVHSFFAQPKAASTRLAVTNYGDHEITAVVAEGNISGCQFHPERSAENGLHILQNFASI